jgi:hypothetical protein
MGRSLRWVGWTLICGMILGVAGLPRRSAAVPVLWGVEEDRGLLFSIADYTEIPNGPEAAGLTIYGKIRFEEPDELPRSCQELDGLPEDIGRHMEAFTLSDDGIAYISVNNDVGETQEPVLLQFDIHTASTTEPIIAEVLGTIGVDGYGGDDNISGLSFDPRSGELFALWRRGSLDDDRVDHLLTVNPLDPSGVVDLGPISGMGEAVGSGEDLEFDEFGHLFVTDNDSDELYRVDPLSAAILEVVLSEGDHIKVEGLVWDPENDRLIATDDRKDRFLLFDVDGGSFSALGGLPGLTDVEGLGIVPEPSAGLLLCGALVTLQALRRRRRSSHR